MNITIPIINNTNVLKILIIYHTENRGRRYKNVRPTLRKITDRIIIPPTTKQRPIA
jgi:hypothetical protein